MSATIIDPNRLPRPASIAPAVGNSLPDAGAVPVLASRDYSRLRTLARLWLRPDDPVGRALTEKLDACRVVRPDAVPPSVAVLGARIVFAAAGSVPESRVLVMPEEYADGGWTLPVSAPLGAALLGAAAGDWVEVVQRDGSRLDVHLIAVDHRSGLMPFTGPLAGSVPAGGRGVFGANQDDDPPPAAA
jgi:regulator of nucleoside diphosphate kinase